MSCNERAQIKSVVACTVESVWEPAAFTQDDLATGKSQLLTSTIAASESTFQGVEPMRFDQRGDYGDVVGNTTEGVVIGLPLDWRYFVPPFAEKVFSMITWRDGAYLLTNGIRRKCFYFSTALELRSIDIGRFATCRC